MRELIRGTGAYKILKNERATGTLSHAYLIIFPDKRNLRSALKQFAKLLLAADERAEGLIERECFSDCLIYPTAGKKPTVADADGAIAESRIKPIEGEEKLIIFDAFQDAMPVMQNKLLKVLEEPPSGVRILIGATSEFPILPTIKSRAKKLEIPPFNDREIVGFLRRNYPRAEGLEAFAAASGGIAGEAEELLDGGYYQELMADAMAFAGAEEEDFPALSIKMNGIKQKNEFLALLRLVFRDMLMYNLNGEILLKSEEKRIGELSKGYTPSSLIAALEIISVAERDLKFNAYFPMLAESVFININKEKQKCRR